MNKLYSKKKDRKFISTTIGMLVRHENLNRPIMLSCEFYRVGDNVELHAISANNLERITRIPTVVVSKEEFSDRDYDHYDSQTEFWWAMRKLGCNLDFNNDFD